MGRWYPLGKEGISEKQAWPSKEICQSENGQVCYDLGEDEPGDFVLTDGVASLDPVAKAARLAAEAFQAKVSRREKLIKKGLRVIAYIAAINEDKELTPEQSASLVTTYTVPQLLLLSGSLVSARGLINSLTADGVIMMAADKTAILMELDRLIAEG